MGKTGTTEWNQVKGTKGQIRLVPRKESNVKKPGPNQRFKSQSTIRKIERSASRGGRDGPRGAARGGARGGSRGGRGKRPGQGIPLRTMAARRRMARSKTSVLGAKQRSK